MAIEIAGITDAELDKALANIALLPKTEQVQLLAALDELEKTQTVEKRQNTFGVCKTCISWLQSWRTP